jgi:hypothetical protein
MTAAICVMPIALIRHYWEDAAKMFFIQEYLILHG